MIAPDASVRRAGPVLVACALLVALPSPARAQLPDSAEAGAPHGARDPHLLAVQEGVDFSVYDGAGNAASLGRLVETAAAGEALLVGEEHEDRVGHAVELELLAGIFGRLGDAGQDGRPLVLSLEMFERDVQYVVDEYLSGLISEEHFLASARPWDNYATGYRPLVEFARAHGLAVVAANAPRRYVSRVTAEGPDALLELSPLAQSFLPPLPYPGPSEAYRAEWDRLMTSDSADAHGHAVDSNAIQAQALWDAAMGHAIAGTLTRRLGALVVHFAGSFHVARGTGIPERVADYRPGTRVTTVVIVTAEDIGSWSEAEHAGLADFVVLTATRAPG